MPFEHMAGHSTHEARNARELVSTRLHYTETGGLFGGDAAE